METLPGKEGLTILRRLIAYAEKIFQVSGVVVAGVMDLRQQPRIPASRVVQSVAALFWARLGSLNALELAAHSSFCRRWLGQPVCSAGSVGRVTALMDAGGLRRGIHHNLRSSEAQQGLAGSGRAGCCRPGWPRKPCQLPPPLSGLPGTNHPRRQDGPDAVLSQASHPDAAAWGAPWRPAHTAPAGF